MKPAEPRRSPSFLPSLSKNSVFPSKLFQRKLWWFCGISMSCKASKPKVSVSKFFRSGGLLSALFQTPVAPRGFENVEPFAEATARWVGDVFMGEQRSGQREF